ncbi:MAG: HigA family addiction module antidote protein [Nitrospinae bacterium]|nr:HigA family addiction module antidote protein [Nitrospinota bacterium]
MPFLDSPTETHPFIKKYLHPLDLTVSKAAEILGVRRATLSDLVNGKTALSPEMALRLEKAFAVKMDFLLRVQALYDAARMRKVGKRIDVARFQPGKKRLQTIV